MVISEKLIVCKHGWWEKATGIREEKVSRMTTSSALSRLNRERAPNKESEAIDLRDFLEIQQQEVCIGDSVCAMKLIYGTTWRQK